MYIWSYRPRGWLNRLWLFVVVSISSISVAQQDNDRLEVVEAIMLAQAQDPWLQASNFREESLRALSVSAGSFPDPVVSVGLANLPTNSWDFSQEAMTQFTVGIAQAIPRGETLSLRREQLSINGSEHPHLRENRRAWLAMTVSSLWLDVYLAQQTIELVRNERGLFEQLVDVVELNYTSAFGNTRQHDLVSAQLELTSLEDRLKLLELNQRVAQSQLSEWIGEKAYQAVSTRLPDLVDSTFGSPPSAGVESILVLHPQIRAIDQQIYSRELGVSLAKQQYKPKWSLSANYGYREDDIAGNTRADLFSVGVGFDLPIFTGNRQDRLVESAVAESAATKTDRILALRDLRSGYETAVERIDLLQQRLSIYDTRLLNQMSEQAESSLSAYINDDGDFAEVIRAYIVELNSKIERLNIAVDIVNTLSQIDYYLAGRERSDFAAGVTQ